MSSRVLLPKHVRRVVAKGKTYYYFNTGKLVDGKVKWARLPDIRSSDFGGSYATMLGHRNRRPKCSGLTIPELIDLFQKSPQWRELASSSRTNYDIYLRRLRSLLPTAPVGEVTRADLRLLIDGMADTPGAANLFLGTCSSLFKWAVEREYVQISPTKGIRPLPMGEHEPWPEPVLEAALASDDLDIRLLVHMLYYTAQRIGDVLAMRWTDIRDGRIEIVQQKTGKELSIPLHRELANELARQRKLGITIAINRTSGRPYTQQTALNMLKAFAAARGCKVVTHGLRKNAVNALLEHQCSVSETAAISGQSLQLVEHYAKKRNQKKLSGSAMLRWESNG